MVTYQDLSKDVDPIAHLFGDVKLTVPQSRLTPELVARFYERGIQGLGVEELQHCTTDNPDGLKSLPNLLRYEPGHFEKKWLNLTADKAVIKTALPGRTPYQLQYFVAFGFEVPQWKELKSERVVHRWGGEDDILTPIVCDALLVGKNGLLYFVTATWSPKGQYVAYEDVPRNSSEGHFVFDLTDLVMETISWQDHRVIERIRNGRWSDTMAFGARMQLALEGSASILEIRAKRMRRSKRILNQMSIYYGR